MGGEHLAYVVNPTYRLDSRDGNRIAVVHLYGRLKDGRSFLVRKKHSPYFFVPSGTDETVRELAGTIAPVIVERSNLKSMQGQSLSKVTTKIPSDVPKIREILEQKGIECFEADIRFAYRAMMDWGIHSVFKLKGEGKEDSGHNVDVVFDEPEISSCEEFIPTLSTLSFDIESSKDSGQVYCISCYGLDKDGNERREKLIVSDSSVGDAKCFENEGKMIAGFAKLVIDWDPDLITGWNVIDFDIQLLAKRAEKYGMTLNLGRDGSPVKLRIQTNFFRDSTADVTGRVVIDGIAALKGAFIKLPNYKLATAARKFTDEKKLIEETGREKYEEIDRMFREDKEALLEYNMHDSVLAHKILENSGVLGLTVRRSLLVGMPPDRVNASIAGLDSLYLRDLHARGYVAPCAGKFGSRGDGVGGFVMQPKPGIYNFVIVCDFKSLYPSLMRTFNIDPLTFVPSEETEGKDLIMAPNGVGFRRELGIIPGILEKFWKAREEARLAKDELSRFAIKIHMNSIYGVLASPNCRFFNRQLGNAITSFAQYFIKLTAEEVRKNGFEVIYGDTDSIFVNLDTEDYDKAQKLGQQIESEMNAMLKEKIETEYKVESRLELEFEKTYLSFIIPRGRGQESGAKKRYAGLIRTADGGEKITFTGLESVRRDWTDVSKEFQYELFRRVFHKEEVAGYVKRFIEEVKDGKHDDKLIYRKALRKNVSEYTKTTPPHVKAAKLLPSIESDIIEYVMTEAGPEPIQAQKHKLDYAHYIDKQLKPIADSILSFYNTSFDEQLEGSSQSSLFDF